MDRHPAHLSEIRPIQKAKEGGNPVDKLNIANLAKGALLERADIEIKKVLENISDKNTDWKKSRKVTLTLDFKAMDESREAIKVDLQAKSSVAPYNPVSTQIFIDKNENGEVVAQEFVKGQMKDQIAIDTDTGEILENKPVKGHKIVGINR